MIAHPERTVVTTLARAPWAAGVVFSLAMHAALAAIIVGQSAQAPAVGGTVVIDVVLVDGPDAAPAADPAAPELVVPDVAATAPDTPDTETSELPAPDAPAFLIEALGARDTRRDEPTATPTENPVPTPAARGAAQAAADAAAEKLTEIAAPTAAPPTPAKITPRPRPVDMAGPEKSLSKDAARAAADAAAEKKPDAKAQSVSKNTAPKGNAATRDKIGDSGPPTQKAALPSGASRGASPLAGNPKPAYPRLARRRNQEGRVRLRVLIMPDGSSGAVTVVESSGHGILDRAAVTAVSTWRFRPATRAGVAVTSVLEVPVRFRLRQDAE